MVTYVVNRVQIGWPGHYILQSSSNRLAFRSLTFGALLQQVGSGAYISGIFPPSGW